MMLNVHMQMDDEVAGEKLRALLDPAIALTVGKVVPETAVIHILISGRPSRDDLLAHPELHTLIIPWAGIPTETRDLMQSFAHIVVHNLHHNAQPVAETVLTLLMAAAKLTIPYDRALRRHDWTLRYDKSRPAMLLCGKTALILGYGAIGQRVGALCHALGMRVLATKRDEVKTIGVFEATLSCVGADKPQGSVTVYPPSALHDLLPQANVLIICLPLTPETEGLIGETELGLLPDQAILVNIGRGPIVDEGALFAALQNGRLHAAGLDVWYSYPKDEPSRQNTPPSRYPFHELDNVVMSPHRGGSTEMTEALRMEGLAALLHTAVCGDPMPNRIDLQAGY